jgi:hypothetical protein
MHNVALTWSQAASLACGLKLAAFSLRLMLVRGWFTSAPRDIAARAASMVNEIGTISALYAAWQFAGSAPVFDAAGAYERGEAIERFQHVVGLPSEHTLQGWLLPHPLLAQSANVYYATMHFGALFALLAWLFFRHRAQYAQVRLVLIVVTVACFVIQLLPVAPPRLLPNAGYVDMAERYGQSMYSAFAAVGPDQLSAMPSVHVAWAGLVALAVWRVASGRWRYLGWLHAAMTIFVVTATANHYWSDGIVALALLAVSDFVVRRLGTRRPQTTLNTPNKEPLSVAKPPDIALAAHDTPDE